ncbi:hypothetical protein HDN1F_35110 [gamma proteobacterium HdN1]|nr:Hypothetical protein HDN1F_18080 [gamma proteobacterium HdN1]CBL47094.1 hypothetical protein HDN1F_35110 [gamma proteobacterium HdN1]
MANVLKTSAALAAALLLSACGAPGQEFVGSWQYEDLRYRSIIEIQRTDDLVFNITKSTYRIPLSSMEAVSLDPTVSKGILRLENERLVAVDQPMAFITYDKPTESIKIGVLGVTYARVP